MGRISGICSVFVVVVVVVVVVVGGGVVVAVDLGVTVSEPIVIVRLSFEMIRTRKGRHDENDTLVFGSEASWTSFDCKIEQHI